MLPFEGMNQPREYLSRRVSTSSLTAQDVGQRMAETHGKKRSMPTLPCLAALNSTFPEAATPT